MTTTNTPSQHPLGKDQLGRLGLETCAYVKPVNVAGQRLHAIYAADGTPITVVNERDTAFATVMQHDLLPVSVH